MSLSDHEQRLLYSFIFSRRFCHVMWQLFSPSVTLTCNTNDNNLEWTGQPHTHSSHTGTTVVKKISTQRRSQKKKRPGQRNTHTQTPYWGQTWGDNDTLNNPESRGCAGIWQEFIQEGLEATGRSIGGNHYMPTRTDVYTFYLRPDLFICALWDMCACASEHIIGGVFAPS